MKGSGVNILDMEELLKLHRLSSNTFRTVCDPWLPPGAQAIYGGTMVAHCMLAAQATVRVECSVASLRSTFVQGGKPRTPIHYEVQKFDADASFPLRAVRASQDGQCIFTAVVRFQSRPQDGSSTCPVAPDAIGTEVVGAVKGGGGAATCPYICSDLEVSSDPDNSAQDIMILQWIKVRWPIVINDAWLHMAALAYMSDNYLLPTATRVHGIRWSRDPEMLPTALEARQARDLNEGVKLMVSLDHTIVFHALPETFRADVWLRCEMQSPWAGQERASVSQRMYAATGHLIATVYQEGVLRMNQPAHSML